MKSNEPQTITRTIDVDRMERDFVTFVEGLNEVLRQETTKRVLNEIISEKDRWAYQTNILCNIRSAGVHNLREYPSTLLDLQRDASFVERRRKAKRDDFTNEDIGIKNDTESWD